MKKKNNLDQEVILLLISTLITTATWVGFEVYRAYTRAIPPEGVEKYLTPLEPSLNLSIFDKLEKRGL